MMRFDDEKTDPILIDRVRTRDDSSAWRRFDATYRPMIRCWGRRLVGGGDEMEELCQIVMWEVAHRILTEKFRYEPDRTFRGWLYRVTRTRSVNLLTARRRRAEQPLPEADLLVGLTSPDTAGGDSATVGDIPRIRLIREIIRSIKARVESDTWDAFLFVYVYEWSVAEVAARQGKTYAATYRNKERVARMLKEEARRRLGEGPGESNGA